MEEFPAEQDAALLLLDRVSEAQRIATMQVTAASGCGMVIAFPALHTSAQRNSLVNGRCGRSTKAKAANARDPEGTRMTTVVE